MSKPLPGATVPLGELVDVISGFAFKSDRFGDVGDWPIIRIRDVKRGYSETFYSGECDEQYLVTDGDLLIGMDGEFNREIWSGGKALLNQRVCKLVPDERKLCPRYLYHFLPDALKEIEDRTPFATVKHLSSKDIKNIPMSLPPLEEQRRIAAILDKADALRRKRKRALELLDTLTQNIFLDMFGDPFKDHSANRANFDKVTTRITYGFTQPMSHYDSGIPILTAKNVRAGSIDFINVDYASREEFEGLTAKSKPEKFDVLITKDGAIGRSACLDVDAEVCINQSVALIKPRHDLVEPLYLLHYLMSPPVQRRIEGMKKGNAIPHLQITELAKFPIALPPLEAQKVFVSKIANLNQLRSRLSATDVKFRALFASLQHRAFLGQL